MIRLEK
ncbi:hypothetical protein YPPY66_2046, partial [Yersinia pestis PY-66]